MIDISALLQEHRVALWWIAIASLAVFVGSLLFVPWLVTRIPADYFSRRSRPRPHFADHHPLLRWIGLVIKNVIGVFLVLAGLAMLVLPGQGLLTLAVGILFLDFPCKHKLEGSIIRRRPVAKSVNWMRKRAGVEPLQLDESPAEQS
ncbi:MAG: PGPGW domain-containing protein [Planctomycetota bacterium]